MDLLRQAKSALISVSAVYLALGIVMVINPIFVSNFICYIIGALLIVVGGSGIFTYIRAGESGKFAKVTLLVSVLFTALGIYILVNPESFASMLPLLVGIMLIIESLDKISNILNAKKNGYEDWWKMIIAAVVVFALGLFLIFYSIESIALVVRIIGVFLIIDAISNLYLAYNYSKI